MHSEFYSEDLEEKRPVGRPWRRWEGNIKMYPKEIICEDGDWIYLARERV
jgi:hypothetical protein